MNENDIQDFWQMHPCGAELVGDLTDKTRDDYVRFFARYDDYRYTKEPHILRNLDRIDWGGREVLEIGIGQGADAEQIARRGGHYTGVDLTEEAVGRVETRFALSGLPYRSIDQASALELPFEDNSFDIVFSHGVLHHIPEIVAAQAEIARVLRPGGRLIAMLYAKYSLNYLFSIAVARRVGLAAMYLTGVKGSVKYAEHLANAKKAGLREYLRMSSFINVSTDGPYNPFSRVYGRREVERDFPAFRITEMHKEFMHAPPLPVGRLPFSSVLGWHLWVTLTPTK